MASRKMQEIFKVFIESKWPDMSHSRLSCSSMSCIFPEKLQEFYHLSDSEVTTVWWFCFWEIEFFKMPQFLGGLSSSEFYYQPHFLIIYDGFALFGIWKHCWAREKKKGNGYKHFLLQTSMGSPKKNKKLWNPNQICSII